MIYSARTQEPRLTLEKELHGSIGARYGNESLKAMLTKKFGDMRLRDLKKKGISTPHSHYSNIIHLISLSH
jgi:hypothetical protein